MNGYINGTLDKKDEHNIFGVDVADNYFIYQQGYELKVNDIGDQGAIYNNLVTPILYNKAVDNWAISTISSIGSFTCPTSNATLLLNAANTATVAMSGFPRYEDYDFPIENTVEQSDYYVFKGASVYEGDYTEVNNYTIFLDKNPVHSDEPHVQIFKQIVVGGMSNTGDPLGGQWLQVFQTGWYPR